MLSSMPRRRAASDSSELTAGARRLLKKTRYQIVVMGAAAVGKSCVVHRLLHEPFLAEYKATVEEMYSGQFEVNGTPVRLDILDTSGSYEFPAMRRLSIATGDAFLLVYSVADPTTFEEVERLHQQIVEEKKDERTPVVVVGNKTDLLEGRSAMTVVTGIAPPPPSSGSAVEETTASIDWGYGYANVSAKEDRNVGGIFRELLAQVNLQMLSSSFEGERAAEGKEALQEGNGHGGEKKNKTRHFSLKGRHHDKQIDKRNSCHVS